VPSAGVGSGPSAPWAQLGAQHQGTHSACLMILLHFCYRRGYADETYVVLAPRHPAARPVALPGAGLGSGAVAAEPTTTAMEGELKEARRSRSHQRLLGQRPGAVVAERRAKGGQAAGAAAPAAEQGEEVLQPLTPGPTLV
jgi:hypothetical protein